MIFSRTKYQTYNSLNINQLVSMLLIGIAVYLPFEVVILKWLPVPDLIFSLLRLSHEILIYVMLLGVLWVRLLKYKGLRKTPLDIPLLIFLLSTFISVAIFRAPWLDSLVSVRLLLRYVAVYYIVINLSISEIWIKRFLYCIVVIGFFQGLLSVIQYFAPQQFNDLFLPRDSEVEIVGRTDSYIALSDLGLKEGSVIGTFGVPASLSSFLLVALITSSVFLSIFGWKKWGIRQQIIYFAGSLLMVFGVFASYKRAALLIAILIPLVVFLKLRKNKSLFTIVLIYGLFVFLGWGALNSDFELETFQSREARTENVGLVSYFGNVFTSEYWTRSASNSRGWFIVNVGRFLLNPFVITNWIGYTPNDDTARWNVIALQPQLKRLEDYEASKDVFWLSMLLNYGIIGLTMWLWFFLILSRYANFLIALNTSYMIKSLGVIFSTALFVAIFYGFIERIFFLRGFAFYFWLLAGLVVQAYQLERKNKVTVRFSV